MKRKILTVILICLLSLSCIACGKTYSEAVSDNGSETNSFGHGYFTVITEWGNQGSYKIVYANDTKVKYFVVSTGYKGGITPLYNADGTLQIYEE